MNTVEIKTRKAPNWIPSLLAVACGVFVANLYYAQPLVGPISSDTHLPLASSGLIVTLTQIGYVIGLLFIVPLCDLIENRRLVSSILVVGVCALIAAALTHNATIFLITSMFIGLGSVATQILVPYAAHLAPEEKRGQMVGNVMSGLLLGIMLARPMASFVTDLWGWQMIFIFSAIITAILTALLACVLPEHNPSPSMSYVDLISSLWSLFTKTAVLRRRAFYQACLFGAFSLFWTVIPLWLASHFHLSQQGIALFALAGVAGAAAAPIAGRLADRGWTKRLTGLAICVAILSFLLTHLFQDSSDYSLAILVIAAIILDMAVSGNLVLSQRAIYSLGGKIRGRVNGVFMAVFFIGGAIGSALGGWAYAYGGWVLASNLGLSMGVVASLYYLTEKSSS
ncbi:MFS transporter [Sporomusa acidovorans]|uniref:Sugar efflux transporter n=1 Tax=Sporomusa acidovorans (strain ATCC 49682 / DSM 3132 / Mol) TaxID=1123286 RepID=A0ABZ3JBI7_SPOA4|nr:MFS transporter [Sporomusa acidovorans]OZC13207.1 putative transporter [Sporomusa acidovorans DSM 3132]SDE01149.1 Predicted arabinose efflux permease, MFS family [Sporomusa acidovorans]